MERKRPRERERKKQIKVSGRDGNNERKRQGEMGVKMRESARRF